MELSADLATAKKLIYSLDLSSVIERLIIFYNWTEKQAREASEQYKHYLFILKKYAYTQQQGLELPPSIDIDEVWHNHILHTKAYTDFCNKVFGQYLHHNPGHGTDAGEAYEKFERMFEITQELYYKETGDYIYAVRASRVDFFNKIINKGLKFLRRNKGNTFIRESGKGS